eukprot:COSAG06_NODE_783_length_12361_cov_10.187408_4_plen_200_part_00
MGPIGWLQRHDIYLTDVRWSLPVKYARVCCTGFGVHTEGPWFHHGSPNVIVETLSNTATMNRKREQNLQANKGAASTEASEQCLTWSEPNAANAADAHMRLTGDYIAALPALLGYSRVDAVSISAGYWCAPRPNTQPPEAHIISILCRSYVKQGCTAWQLQTMSSIVQSANMPGRQTRTNSTTMSLTTIYGALTACSHC